MSLKGVPGRGPAGRQTCGESPRSTEGVQMQTRVTELFGIQYPIVQGGLAHLAFAGLCAAVSNAGGLGQISAATLPGGHDALRAEIHKVRELTAKPFAVNFAI